jgi:uncharacterized LabA/DUF88 family protein
MGMQTDESFDGKRKPNLLMIGSGFLARHNPRQEAGVQFEQPAWKNCTVHRWSKFAFNRQGTWLRHWLQALALRIPGQGRSGSRLFYTTIPDDDEISTIRPLLDWLDYNGYAVITKAMKEFVDVGGHRKVKGNMGIELAVDAMELARHVDHIVLFSGDGAFRPLVGALQRRGVRVTVVSTLSSNPPAIASELRRQADTFIDLESLKAKVSKASRWGTSA